MEKFVGNSVDTNLVGNKSVKSSVGITYFWRNYFHGDSVENALFPTEFNVGGNSVECK